MKFLLRLFQRRVTASPSAPTDAAARDGLAPEAVDVVPYDESLLEKARLAWHIGDWSSLIQLDRDALPHHPERAKLALLIGAAMLQTEQYAAAGSLIRLARDWGCNRQLMAQILIAGVHNTLGTSAVLLGDNASASQHFRLATCSGTPGLDSPLLGETRAANERARLQAALQAAQRDLEPHPIDHQA